MNTQLRRLWLFGFFILLMPNLACLRYSRYAKQKGEKLWAEKKILNYRYTIKTSCFCSSPSLSPVIVEVRNGEAVSTTIKETGEGVSLYFESTDTIPNLFALIQQAIDRQADQVSVSYNAKRGYPESIGIDDKWNTSDDELGIAISDFEVLQSK